MLFGTKRIFAIACAVVANIFLFGYAGYAISGTIDIEGQKVLNGANLSEGQFTFELRKSGSDTVLKTTTNRADGSIVFEDVPYSDEDIIGDKYIIYEVTEVQGDDDTIVYDNNVGYVVLEINEGEAEIVTYAKPTSEEISYEEFEYRTYHASEDELWGTAYSVWDSRDGSLTFFRAEDGAYEDGQYEYIDGGYSDYLHYKIVPESGDEVWDEYYDNITSVRFKDPVRPNGIDFGSFYNCRSFDLRKLDTSRMTDMHGMFRSAKEATTLNVSGFDLENVTDMEYMFYNTLQLRTIVWGTSDTPLLEDIQYMFDTSSVEYFDFSRLNTQNLANADQFFNRPSSYVNPLKRADFSSWRRSDVPTADGSKNRYYTGGILGRFEKGDYLDITNLGDPYSAEINLRFGETNLKVLKLCVTPTGHRTDLFVENGTMLNINTGETVVNNRYEDNKEYCGTYVTLGVENMEFVNRKKASIDIQKVDENGEPLSGATLGLKMDGSIMYSWDTTDEAKHFSDLPYGHDYEIIELDVPAGYKRAEPIEFSVSDEGVVTKDGEVISSIVMEDELDIVNVKKVWGDEGKESFRPSEVKFELREAYSDELIDEMTLSADDSTDEYTWEGGFNVMNRYDINDYEHSYKVVEVGASSNYTISYKAEESDEGSANPLISDSVIITNDFTGATFDYEFIKKWDDEGYESERPESITFDLFEESDKDTILAEIVLTSDDADEEDSNVWHGAFVDIPNINNDGEEAKYLIVEKAMSGYETSYAYDSKYSENIVNILELTCEAQAPALGGYFGVLYDNSDKESETLSGVSFQGYNGTTFHLKASNKDDILVVVPGSKCSGRVINGREESISQDVAPSNISRESMESSFAQYGVTPSEVSRSDELEMDFDGLKVFAINMEREESYEESNNSFVGANVITNHRITEEEAKPADTGDKVMVSVIILTISISGLFVAKTTYSRR